MTTTFRWSTATYTHNNIIFYVPRFINVNRVGLLPHICCTDTGRSYAWSVLLYSCVGMATCCAADFVTLPKWFAYLSNITLLVDWKLLWLTVRWLDLSSIPPLPLLIQLLSNEICGSLSLRRTCRYCLKSLSLMYFQKACAQSWR